MAEQVGSIFYDLDLDDKKFKSGLDGAERSADSLTRYLERSKGASLALAGALAAAGAAAFGMAVKSIRSAGQIETMRAGFITLLGSAEEADKAIQKIKKDAADTPFELPGLIRANQLLTSVTKDANRSEKFLLNIGKALTAMGKGQPELDRVIINLQQIGAVGKASMMDIKQFAFAGIPIFDMLAKKTGLTGDALESFISSGSVSFELLEELFNNAGTASGRFAKAFETQAGGFDQLWSNFMDNLNIFGIDFVTQIGLFDWAKDSLNKFNSTIGKFSERVKEAGGFGKYFQRIFKENQTLLSTIAGAITAALIPAFLALLVPILSSVAALLPFIAIGAAVGFVVSKLVERFGGWGAIIDRVTGLVSSLKDKAQALIDKFNAIASSGEIFGIKINVIIEVLKIVAGVIKDKLIGIIQNLRKKIISSSSSLNGFKGIVSRVRSVLDLVGGVLDKTVKPAFEALFEVVRTEVLPSLTNLWSLIKTYILPLLVKILIPILKVVAAVLGVVLVAAVTIVIRVFTEFAKNISRGIDLIVKLVLKIVNMINLVKRIPKIFKAALSNASEILINAFQAAFDWIIEKVEGVKEALDKINPFHRESPSLVDNVKSGVAAIIESYGSLDGLVLKPVAASASGAADIPPVSPNGTQLNLQQNFTDTVVDPSAIARSISFELRKIYV